MYRTISDDFFFAIRPLLYVSRALGIATFAYVKKTLAGGKTVVQLEHSSAAFFYSIFVVALYLCLFVVSITLKYLYVFSQPSATDTFTDILLHTASVTSLLSLVLSVTKNRNPIVRIMLLISETDSIILTCPREYYKKENTRFMKQLLVICIFLVFTLTFDNITWSLNLGLKVLTYCHMYVDTLVEWILIIQFMNMVILLKDRVSLLNTRLANLSGVFEIENPTEGFYVPLCKRMSISVKEMKSRLTSKEVLTFNNIHDMLFDTVLLIKSTYQVQILFSLLSTFVGISIRSYFGLCVLYIYGTANITGISVSTAILSHVLWCSMHMAKLLCITIPCHSANSKMAHTSTVLRKLLLAFLADPGTMSEL
jgi:hypothetical protein